MHRPVKHPRSNARPSAVVEPVSTSAEKCHPDQAAGFDRGWWCHLHDPIDLSCDQFLRQSGWKRPGCCSADRHAGALDQWCSDRQRIALLMAHPVDHPAGHRWRRDFGAGDRLFALSARSSTAGLRCRPLLASD